MIDRERLALLIASIKTGGVTYPHFDGCPPKFVAECHAGFDAILSDISAQGFVIVPKEPTPEMRKAGETEMMERHTNLDCFRDPYVDSTWSAMIAAALRARSETM